MKHETIHYKDNDQALIGQLFSPDNLLDKNPAIIVFPAFEGLSAFALDYAKNLAEKGYIAFGADVYGDGQTADTIEGCFDLISPFLQDRALVRRRSCLAFEVLANHTQVDPACIASIGFCFGGMCGLEVARSGANIQATVSAHGVLGKSDLPNHGIKGSVLALHGYQDPQIPPESLKPFAEEMQTEGVEDWRLLFFGKGKHSFTDPKTGTFNAAKEAEMGREYNKTAADATWQYALGFFEEKLKG